MESDFEVVIIGAGVIGLAIASQISENHNVLVIEKNERFGLESSSHNSEVIHAGIYYPLNSNKHLLCIKGNQLIYDWAKQFSVPHLKIGKIVSATTDSSLTALEDAWELAQSSGANIKKINKNILNKLKLNLNITDGFFSIDSGIIDSASYLNSLEFVARNNGTIFGYSSKVIEIEKINSGYKIVLQNNDDSIGTVICESIINAAGHGSPSIAAMIGYPLDGGTDSMPILEQVINKGVYFDIINNNINKLIDYLLYPVPDNEENMQDYISAFGGLGIHVTKSVNGTMKLGPDSEWIDEKNLSYINDGKRLEAFYRAGKLLIPRLKVDDLSPGQVGFRSRIKTKDEQYPDFLIWQDENYIHLGGIESPGLTASLAIAERVNDFFSD
ncbi:MAG: NAD(P)/FAD-dependent oxidoreductase [Dehalococcoidia bacterium]|nr:NAD(P)/FAD-dependent oxidoreductase [Dehalococcoidia bacterium]